jgi:general stress protein CsbA
MELIKQEYFESLFVGFCASTTMIIGMLVLQKKKSNKRL